MADPGFAVSGAGTPGLGGIRSDIEHHPQPRDPFALNVWPILDELHLAFGEIYHVGYSSGWCWASPVGGSGKRLKAISPDDLIREMRAAGGSW